MLRKVVLIAILAVAIKYLKDFDLDFFQENFQDSKNPFVYNGDFLIKSKAEGKLYLGILGNICITKFLFLNSYKILYKLKLKYFTLKDDVTKGEKHYKKGGSYEHFIGIDASRSFVTGDFKKDLTDNLDGLSDAQVADLINWKQFYDTTYTFIGILEGRFYNSKKIHHLNYYFFKV
jgi:hypothetical protein